MALCRLLLSKPDLLLLDEPTNHLDAESVAWLERTLQDYPGTVVAVTHDRYFLDNVAGWILELDRGAGIPWEGNYSSWLEQKQDRLAARAAGRHGPARTRSQRELEWIRMSPRARQSKGKARINAYNDLVAEAEAAERRADKLEIAIPPGPRLGDRVVDAERPGQGLRRPAAHRRPVVPPAARAASSGVIGPNGAGKTTLFRMMVGEEQPDARHARRRARRCELAYVDQSRDQLDPDATVFEEITGGVDHMVVGGREIHGRAYVASFGFKGSDQQKKVGQLSGGERNRVQLAKVLKARRQRPAARRADQRPRRRHPAGPRGGAARRSPAARWSSATTAGSSTASPPTCSPSRATPRSGGSRATSATTRPTATSGSAPTPTSPTASATSRSCGTEPGATATRGRPRAGACGRRTFASDNWAGVHPEVLEALARANDGGHAPAYGADPWTGRGRPAAGRSTSAPDTEAYFAFNGTGTNVVGLQSLLRPFEAVVCAEGAHIDVDECGAPERFLGSKLLTVADPGRQADPGAGWPSAVTGIGDEHHVQARVVSITQSTEVGTVLLGRRDRRPGRLGPRPRACSLHLDGARIANAAAALGVDFGAFGRSAGVDVLSFGGTKNGALGAEAVVTFRPEADTALRFIRKQSMQLSSKMRFVAAQFVALLTDDLWLRSARHANAMAARLGDGVVGGARGRRWPTRCRPTGCSPCCRRPVDRGAPGRVALLRVGRGHRRRPAGWPRSTPPRPTSTRSWPGWPS